MGSKISDLTALTGANTATGDLFPIVDVSATTAGSKSITRAELWNAMLQASPSTTLVVTNLDAGASGTAGTVDVFPTTASKGKLQIAVTDQTGDTTVTLQIGAMATTRAVTLRDPGATASLLTTTDATAAAVAATAVEIARTCDVSARAVLAGGTLAVTEALHDGKTVLLDQAAGSVCTLPAATGTGMRLRFVVHTLATSNSHIVKVNGTPGTDVIRGVLMSIDSDTSEAVAGFGTTATSDTITLNRSTTGSVHIGETIELEDVKTGFWAITNGWFAATGSPGTPFTAAVP